jgi:hypothetical protein
MLILYAMQTLVNTSLQDLVEGEDDEDDDLEAKITEEHVKFKEAQAEYQKQVRAARPWSAPPLGSPRPEKQRKREAEQLETLQESSSTLGSPSVSERNEYIPPERPQVERAAAKGGSSLSYMAPPRPMSADTIRYIGSLKLIKFSLHRCRRDMKFLEGVCPVTCFVCGGI